MNIHSWLAATHIWLLYGLLGTAIAGRWFHCFLVLCVGLASTLMHISETKHNLVPEKRWIKWSAWCLNADRFFAVTVSLYFLWVRWPLDFQERDFWLIRLSAFGLMCTIASEMVDGLAYASLHTLWHLCIFTVLNCVA